MRLKILFFPLILIASISVFIVFVWPEITDIRKMSAENKTAMGKLALIKEKKNIVRSLDQDLGKNSDKEKLVNIYLSANRNEERIINAASYLATSTGVSLADISIEESVSTTSESVDDIPESRGPFAPSQPGNGNVLESEPIVNLKNMQFKMTVSGKYENIKAFLSGMNKMELMNNVKGVTISVQKSETEEGEGSQVADILSAEISSEFYYLDKIKAQGNYGLKVLNAPNFDFAQVEKIKQFISQGASAMESGEKGSRNPFIAF